MASTPNKKQEMDHSIKEEDLDEATVQNEMRNLQDESMERDMNLGTCTLYSAKEGSAGEIERDMWKQSTRVSISGWKAALMACVDKAPERA